MLKFHEDKGSIKEFEFNGDLAEMAADVASMIGFMHKKVKESNKAEGKVFEHLILHAVAASLALNALEDEEEKPKKKESKSDDFTSDFLKFLYGADDQ